MDEMDADTGIDPSINYLKRSSAGSKTPDTPSRCISPGSPIGDDACPICLGSFTNKCTAGSCLHNFCLVCLKEWAKQRPVCPLCKQPFTKILYDIKSESDYKEWKVPVLCPNELDDIGSSQIIRESIYQTFEDVLDRAKRRFFRYRSTWTNAPRYLEILNDVMDTYPRLPSLPPRSDHRVATERGSSTYRLSIYSNNVWIQPMADETGRCRESNPNLYREQPALTHRLVPWVKRKLATLLPDFLIGVVLSEIMDLIERYPINGGVFRIALRPYLGSRTRYFVNEFYNFARSPYDMVGHDAAVPYVPHYHMDLNETDDDSDGSDDVIGIDSDGGLVETEPLELSSRVAREETVGNDGSVFISSDSDSSYLNIREESRSTEFIPPLLIGDSLLPVEGRTEMRSLNEPGSSGIPSNGSLSVERETIEDLDNSDSSDCLVIDVLKPKKESTPELINISSESESESNDQTHWKKKINKQLHDKSFKGHKKPRLDTEGFPLNFSGSLNCKRGEDHIYCTESTSPLNSVSNKTESDDSFKIRRNLYNPRKRWDLLVSSSDFSSELNTDSNEEYTPGKRKLKLYKTEVERVSNSLSNSTHRLGKKDHKSKIKSSSHLKSKPSTSEENPPVSFSLRKRNLSNNSSKNANVYSKILKHRRSRSSNTSSSDSKVSSISSLNSISSSSTSSSKSYSSSSTNYFSNFSSSTESDEKYYSSSHRKRNGKRLSKGKEGKKRRYSEEKIKESKSFKERGKGTSKKICSKSKKSKGEEKSSKRSTKDTIKHRRN